MGGIVARKRMKEWIDDENTGRLIYTHLYSVVRGDHLAFPDLRAWELGHPLKELRLSEDDIKDKSKADWVVKTIAVIQIARLIFDLVTRGVGGQPVTQLEITTASFSVFAIVTYWVNWWKPKDVSRPTMIDTVIDEGAKGDVVGRTTEPFFARLWRPTPPLHRYDDFFTARDRIRNDELWSVSGMFLSTWVLMATSCLVFGGIHCIAWSFQFPTPVEELAWRIAALVSTGSPILALAGSFAILQYRPMDLKRKLAEAVEETSGCFGYRGGAALTNIDDDGWKEFTRAVKVHPEEDIMRGLERLRWELHMLIELEKSIKTLMRIKESRRHDGHHLTTVWNIARELKTSAGQTLALRGEFEKWVRDTHPSHPYVNLETHPFGAPEGMFQWFFSRCAEEPAGVQSYQEAKKVWDIHAQRLLRVLNISSGIIYTTARLALFGIMFSSLRAVPDGVYDTANWTRFVPSFS